MNDINKLKARRKNMLEQYQEVLSVRELCFILRIGKCKAYELLKSGEISNRKYGKKYFIPKDSVIKFLNVDQ